MLWRLFSLPVAVIMVFFALRVLPGDAITADLIQSGASQTTIDERRTQLGLDKPVFEQFTLYTLSLLKGDLGVSLSRGLPVSEMITGGLGGTLQLATAAFLIALVIGTGLGIAATKSILASLSISILLSMPVYWTGTLALFLFSARLRWVDSDSLVLPASVLGIHIAGSIARITHSSIEEVQHLDFVRTARSKGLPEFRILLQHTLRAGLVPIVSASALQAGFLLSGTVIIETLFLRPGLGRMLLDGVLRRDYPLVQGIVLITVMLYLLIHIIADLLYPAIDPRIRR